MLDFLASIIRNLFRTFSVALLTIFVGLVIFFGVFFYNLVQGLPDVTKLKDYNPPQASQVFSEEGRKIGEFTTERRYPVKFEKIPKHVLHAFVAAEDAKFFEHRGIDYHGILRAIVSNILRGRFAQGASTITQQVARTLLLAVRKKEVTRKVREMILASRMEKELTKQQILHIYLSEIYLGHGAYGIGAAARNYFNKRVEDLSLAEASLLAGLPQRPTDWDPFRNPAISKQRQHYVLKRMVEERYLTEKEAQEVLLTPVKLHKLVELNDKEAPYFTEYVRTYLTEKYGSEVVLNSGLTVYTTVRYDFQKVAERALWEGLRVVDKRLGWRGVVQHFDSTETRDAFLAMMHEEVLEKEISVKILPPVLEAGAKKLLYDMSAIKFPHFHGPTPIREGEYYKAVIIEVKDAKKVAQAKIGQTDVVISLDSMQWIGGDRPLVNISQVLRPGDLVQVKITKIENRVAFGGLEQEPEIQGALLSYELKSGAVRAMVGGTDFGKSEFNRALQAKRQVGSTVKPIIYAAAIDKGFSPSSMVTDSPIVFKVEGEDADAQGQDWRPKNFGNKFEGDIPLRLALIRSMNVPTVKLLNEIGVDYGISYARLLGITAPLPRELTIALGSWSSSLEELMRAYAVFPRLGRAIDLSYVKRVVDGSGNVLEETSVPRQAATSEIAGPSVSPQTAYVMTDLLKGVVREGTGRAASVVPGPIAGKTGTSNDHRDAWFIGYSPEVISGVWLGYDKEKPLDPEETGGKAAAPIWAEYMQFVVKFYPKADFEVPEDIVFAYVDRDTGRLASAQTRLRARVAFKVGTVPDTQGNNLLVVGDPGTPRATTHEDEKTPPKEETSDFIRQGYD